MATTSSVQGSTAVRPDQHNRLLNHIVDDIARDNPDMPYAELPVSPTSFDQGLRDVSYRDLSNAINGIAWWLDRSLGRGKNFETLTYLGPNDLHHTILLLGAVKAGYKVRTKGYRSYWRHILTL